MTVTYLDPWELSDQFPQSVFNYWKPYTDKLDEEDWHLYKIDWMPWTLKSPFLNRQFDVSEVMDSYRDEGHPAWTALYRMDNYYKTIESKDSSISDICCASTYVEKWLRETYLHRYLTQYDISRFTDEEIWELISAIWGNNEYPCQTEEKRQYWYEIFNLRPRPESLVSGFPDKLKIYRGGHPEGFSWSVSRKVGQSFHLRNSRWDESGQNWLCERTVTKDEVAWWDGDEDSYEQEVVVFPTAKNFAYKVLQEEPIEM